MSGCSPCGLCSKAEELIFDFGSLSRMMRYVPPAPLPLNLPWSDLEISQLKRQRKYLHDMQPWTFQVNASIRQLHLRYPAGQGSQEQDIGKESLNISS